MQSDEKTVSLNALGLCRRAGKLICGTPEVIEAVRHTKSVCAVYVAADASDGTKKKIAYKCAFFGVPCYVLPVRTDELAHAVGKHGCTASVAIANAGFLRLMPDTLPPISTGKEPSPRTEGGN